MSTPNARRLWLAAVLAAALTSTASAQPPGPASHRPLGDPLPSSEAAERAMADRLRQLELSRNDSRELQDLARRVLGDDFLEQLKEIDPDQLEKLKEKIGQGGAVANDPALQSLLKQVLEKRQAGGQPMKQKDKELLKRLQEEPNTPDPRTTSPDTPRTAPGTAGNPPANGSTPSGPAPAAHQGSPSWAQWQEDINAWFQNRMSDLPERLGRYLNDTGGGDALRQVLRSVGQDGDAGLPTEVSQRAQDLADSLSGLKKYLPHEGPQFPDVRDLVPNVRLPAVPSVDTGSVPATLSGAGKAEWGLWLIVLAVLGVTLWRVLAARRAAEAAAGWRLGPWPVAPATVATRRDLVAAFEYLALLCLGPAARACNHLDLAARLGGQTPDAERRRAAGELAHLYEQARYAPDDDLLSPDDLAAARRDLCLLAGVAAA
jgi:hypothetical protein